MVKIESIADSSIVVTSSMEIIGPKSSSVIVRVDVVLLIVAFLALERVIVAVSLYSSIVSVRIGTSNVDEVFPA